MSLPFHAALAVKLLCWLLALAVFFRLLARYSRFTGPQRRRLLAAMVLGALAGSKSVHALTYPTFFLAPQDLIGDRALAWLSGDSVPGALLGGRLALWLADRKQGAGREADGLVIPATATLLVLSLGGFFWALRGTGFGSPTSLPWGVDFGDGALRHPVMLYEAACLALLFWLAHAREGARLAPGEATRLFLTAYCMLTILSGYLKPPFHPALLLEAVQPRPWVYASVMTAEQWVAAFAVLVMLPGFLATLNRLHSRS